MALALGVAAQQGIHRYKQGGVRGLGPGLFIGLQHVPLFLQAHIQRRVGPVTQKGQRAFGHMGGELAQCCIHGFRRCAAFAQEDVTQRRGIKLAQTGQADQLPARKACQIAAAGVFEVADQCYAGTFGNMGLHGVTHGIDPQRLVVIVAYGHALNALCILF